MLSFRRSKKIGPFRVNLSKSGVGLSAGIKGLTVGMDSKGRAYRSANIPGTGIYSRKYFSNSPQKNNFESGIGINSTNNLLGFDYPKKGFISKGFFGLSKTSLWIFSIILIPFTIGIFTTIGLIIYTYLNNKKPKSIFNKNFLIGLSKAKKGDFNSAIENLSIAEKHDPKNQYLIDLKGVCLYQSEKYTEAIPYFEKLWNIEKSERVNMILSEIYRKDDNPDNYKKILTLNKEYLINNPTDSETLFLTGYYSYKVGEYDNAISYLQKISEDEQLYLQSLNAISSCFYEKKEIETAIQVLQKAPLRKQKLDSDLKDIHYTLGCLYQELKEKGNSLKHFKKVISEEINYKDIKERIEIVNNL